MREFVSPSIDIESSYREMTPDKADNASFRFGFAARYRAAGDNSDNTLYDLRTFNVGCVIDNRMVPGSYRHAPAEDAQAAKAEERRAKAVAADWELPLLRMESGRLYDKFIGESDKNLEKALDAAEHM